MANYTLEEVTSRRAAREFLDLPKRLYRDEPHWICPLDSDIENRFRPQTNELLHDGEAIRWIALDEPEPAVRAIRSSARHRRANSITTGAYCRWRIAARTPADRSFSSA